MNSFKLSTLNLLRKVPAIGKWVDRLYCKELIKELTVINGNFGKSRVRFKDNIHQLYDVLQSASLTLEEDFGWLTDQRIKAYTKTSGEAYRLLDGVINNRSSAPPSAYFRTSEVQTPLSLKQWYSNAYSVDQFFDLGVTLIGLYCSVYPATDVIADSPTGSVMDHKDLRHNPLLQLLLSGTEFKLIVSDVIEVTTLICRSRIRNRHGKEKA